MKPYASYRKQEVTHLSKTSPLPEQDGLCGGHLCPRISKDQQKALGRESSDCTCFKSPRQFFFGKTLCDFLLVGGCNHIFKVVDPTEN